MASKQAVFIGNELDAGDMGKRKDMSDFDKGEIVMARRLGWSISEMACGVFPVSGSEYIPTVIRGEKN